MAGNQDPPKAQDIEDLFDGNICRCTGYRPILDAMKSFAEDADPDIKSRLAKLPDTAQRTCPISQRKCVGHGHCETKESSGDGCSIKAKIGSHKNGKIGSQNTPEGNWLFPHSMDELMSILKTLPDDNKYRLVAGNTGTGIFVD
jgi:xanthine dehydrogenase/oxidase